MARPCPGAPAPEPKRLKPPSFPDPQPDLTGATLSELTLSFWAKSGKSDPTTWLSVSQHLMDAADVAGLLFGHYLSEHHRRLLASVWDGDTSKARAALVFLAGVHDVGKISLHFCCQHTGLAEFVRELGLPVPEKRDVQHREHLPHGFASQFALVDAVAAGGGERERAALWGVIVGVHHGRYPDPAVLGVARKEYEGGPGCLGREPRWHESRQEIIRWMARRSGFSVENCVGTALPELPISVAAAYSSVVVMADWLASNEDYFPLLPQEERREPLNPVEQRRRVERGWSRAKVLPPVRAPRREETSPRDHYRHRFGWGPEMQPTRAQQRAVEIVNDGAPDLMIVEAPPGSGKTELAFAVAEGLMRKRGLQGVMIALPTQATTDAMYVRSVAWLKSILEDSPQEIGIHLAHGKNDLNEGFISLFSRRQTPVQVYDDESGGGRENGLLASRWMALRWRATLSPVVVGTIDQVLLAALKSRHVLMRHLGLMGKVVIIDEVHAADTYMEVYLETALTWLGLYQVPVVLLSATLPSDRRRGLVAAYRRGRTRGELSDDPGLDGDIGYPVITTVGEAGRTVHREVVSGGGVHAPKRIVPLDVVDENSLADLLWEKTRKGGCAVVIRNTVRAAQETYDVLAQRFGTDEVTLLHSRFLACDRVELDKRMLCLFGKDGSNRPGRHIVVATQVIEQSLDVDFDVMITDPAPMDLVLQRIGRLHRHPGRRRPAGLEEAVCHVIVTDRSVSPWGYGRGSEVVYGAYPLLRFLGVLADHPDGIVVEEPGDYAAYTQLAYSTKEVGPQSWAEAIGKAREKQDVENNRSIDKARHYFLNGLRLPKWKADALVSSFAGNAATGDEGLNKDGICAQAAVRDTEDQIPVLIVPLDPSMGNIPIIPPWLEDEDGIPVALDVGTWPSAGQVRQVRSWSVSLPPWSFRDKDDVLDETIEKIVSAIWDCEITRNWEWLEHPLLRGELILPMSRVDAYSTRLETELHNRKLVYTQEKGLEVQELDRM